jgi:outer membrane receptor protein involved in Fe transport
MTSLFAGASAAAWSSSLGAERFDTDGYGLVVPNQRGLVDVDASSRHTTVEAMLRRGSLFLRAATYDESRGNGTPLTINDTHLWQLAGGFDSIGTLSLALRAYVLEQRYHQTFTAIAADRNSERLTVDQRVPSRASGLSLDWRPLFGTTGAVLGADLHDVEGTSHEENVAATGVVTPSRAGGHQRTGALHAMLFTQRDRLTLTAGVRADDWRNFEAEQNGAPLASRHDLAWSPRVTALFDVAPRLSLSAAAYSAFRAPTLNELYRGFRVGNVVTQPNATLGPERLRGFEVGARSGGLRVTLFDMRVTDTIANVTITTTPALITRRRENFGSSRSRGVEASWARAFGATSVTAGVLFADATLSSGADTPQVPRQQATLALEQRGWIADCGLQLRWSSRQFDDDLNQFRLRPAFVADFFASRSLGNHLEATFAIENVFDERVEASATPVTTLGQPRAARIGLRYALRR